MKIISYFRFYSDNSQILKILIQTFVGNIDKLLSRQSAFILNYSFTLILTIY
jgi:hypothetical protein